MEFENIYQKMAQNVIQYAQDLRFFYCTYQGLEIDDNIFDSVNNTNKNISACTQEKQSENKDLKSNYERNTSANDKSAD